MKRHDPSLREADLVGPELSDAQHVVLMSGIAGKSIGLRPSLVKVNESALDELASWGARERLDGLLWNALVSGELEPSEEPGASSGSGANDAEVGDRGTSSRRARETHLAYLRVSLAVEATAAWSVVTLRRANIDAYLFKGTANAHLDYPDPALRTFFDADLLVRRADFPLAIEVLLAAGCSRTSPPLRKRWEHRFARAVELRSPQGVEIDLHAALATGYFGEILDHDALRVEPDVVQLGQVECSTFGSAARLLISSYAIVLSRGPSLRLYRDLAQQLLITQADWRCAVGLAGSGEVVLAEGLLRLGRLLGIEHEAIEWARGIVPSPVARKALDYADAAEHQGWSADARSTMLALTVVDRGRFLAGVVAPSRESLRARQRTAFGHLTRSHRRSD